MRWERKTEWQSRAEDGVAMETEGRNGEEDRMEKAEEDSAEEGLDRLDEEDRSHERSLGANRLAKEGKCDPEICAVQTRVGRPWEPASPCPRGLTALDSEAVGWKCCSPTPRTSHMYSSKGPTRLKAA